MVRMEGMLPSQVVYLDPGGNNRIYLWVSGD